MKLDLPVGGRVMFVDPGIDGTGIAVWHAWRRLSTPRRPGYTTVLHPRGCTWLTRLRHLLHAWRHELSFDGSVSRPNVIIIEDAALWSGSAKSQAAATRGDLLKLAKVIGALCAVAVEYAENCRVQLIPPSQWKGQLPKGVVKHRIRSVFELPAHHHLLREHVADAVGMGLAAMGAL